MNHLRTLSRRTAIIIAISAGILVLAAGAAFTASFTMTAKDLGASATSAAGCDSTGITVSVASPLTYSIGSAPGYDIVPLNLSNVDPSCDGRRYKATIAGATNLLCVTESTGTLSLSGTNATITMPRTNGCTLPYAGAGTGGVGSVTLTIYE